ncbi:MAG: hypothetical protein ACKV19_27400 [Verrucomicrobiales bacterium]
MMTPADLKASADADSEPPAHLGDEARALWLCRAGRWDEAHAVAQEIHTPMGSWIHALLHLIEGDEGNARYWYARAARPPSALDAIEAEWERIAASVQKAHGN